MCARRPLAGVGSQCLVPRGWAGGPSGTPGVMTELTQQCTRWDPPEWPVQMPRRRRLGRWPGREPPKTRGSSDLLVLLSAREHRPLTRAPPRAVLASEEVGRPRVAANGTLCRQLTYLELTPCPCPTEEAGQYLKPPSLEAETGWGGGLRGCPAPQQSCQSRPLASCPPSLPQFFPRHREAR